MWSVARKAAESLIVQTSESNSVEFRVEINLLPIFVPMNASKKVWRVYLDDAWVCTATIVASTVIRSDLNDLDLEIITKDYVQE